MEGSPPNTIPAVQDVCPGLPDAEARVRREEKRAERLATDLLRLLRSKLSTSAQTLVLNEAVLSVGAVDRSLLHRRGNVARVADSFMSMKLQVQPARL